MRFFIKDIFITLATICFLTICLEILVDYYPNEFSAKYNHWYENRDQITTLLIGNSHIQSNIDASVLGPDAYNMAVGGSNMNHVVKMAESYIPQMDNLNTVIVNFDYLPVYGDTDNYNTNKSKKDDKWEDYLNYIHHKYLHINTSCSHFDYAITCGQLHFKTLLTYNLTDLNQGKLDGKFNDNPYYKIGKSSLQDFHSQVNKIVIIAQLASMRKARLIVVTSPTVGTRLRQIVQRNVDLMNNTMDSLSLIYPIEYRNYLIDTSLLHEELFADMQHLNRKGAKILTQRIVNDFGL